MKFSINAIKGVIAHELGHQVDYKNKRMGIIKGIIHTYKCSKNEAYRSKFEKEADKIAAQRGFGKEYIEAMICHNFLLY